MTYYIAIASALLFVPAIFFVIGWCIDGHVKWAAKAAIVALAIILLLVAGFWGVLYILEGCQQQPQPVKAEIDL